jgi:thiamine biosynthesis lipoprotein
MSAATLPERRTRAFVEQVMGMPVSIHVRAADPDREEVTGAVANAFAHLRRVDAVLSPWRPDSDLMRVRHGLLRRSDAHPWLTEVEDLCARAEEETGGLFTSTLRGPDDTVGFDPTGLAKGWGVAGAAAHLQLVPGTAWSVNAGGDIQCGVGTGVDPDASPWRIGLQDPHDPQRVGDVVTVTTGAVATSGNAARGAHVVDPRTGLPVQREGSVTVLGPDLVQADVWATALWVEPTAQHLLEAARPGYVVRWQP